MHFSLFISIWTLMLLIPLGFIIRRIYRNRATKAATERFAKQLQQHPVLGKDFALTLYRPVAWIDFTPSLESKNLPTLLNSLPSRIGAFLIHYRQWVSTDHWLLITTVGYFRPYSTGHELFTPVYSGNWETYNLNFVIQFDPVKRQVVVLSDLYTTLVDKNLRADFATAIFKML
ncbi:hypothetical protein [Spirosoma luteum]|uniref:hypothetical protein n=1 Tax=Spirosoma luteum TaxID=431553 RepID=UPI00037E8A0E|nr:hypothetical protein [Spirosoma luteum]